MKIKKREYKKKITIVCTSLIIILIISMHHWYYAKSDIKVQKYYSKDQVITKNTKNKNSIIDNINNNLNNNINLEINNLIFKYNQDNIIFKNNSLNLNFNNKNIYIITGASGSGKSTFAKLISGQLKPQSGIIKINNQDIYTIGDYQKQKLITYLTQDNNILQLSLRDNLLLGLPPEANTQINTQTYHDTELTEILEKFNLKLNLDTQIYNNSLSTGQRQIIKFINFYLRVLYYKPLIIILDEPTSNLDQENKNNILEKINLLSKNILTIIITNNINLNINYNPILITDFSKITQNSIINFKSIN